MLWTARFLVGEAGGRDDPGNHAVIWAMFNRYALFTRTVYPSFEAFVRAYSTPLQPVLNSRGAAERHMDNPDFVRTGGTYPGTSVPKGQLGRFLRLQRTPWRELPAAARALALRALSGGQPNPGIGNASEFADTAVYFKDRNKRVPDRSRVAPFHHRLSRSAGKKWTWIGDVPGLVQYRRNTFYLDDRVRGLAARRGSCAAAMIIDCHCHAGQGDGLTGPWDTAAPLDAYLQRAARAGIARTVLLRGLSFRLRRGQSRGRAIVARSPGASTASPSSMPQRDRGRVLPMVHGGGRALRLRRDQGTPARRAGSRARSAMWHARSRLPVLYDLDGRGVRWWNCWRRSIPTSSSSFRTWAALPTTGGRSWR